MSRLLSVDPHSWQVGQNIAGHGREADPETGCKSCTEVLREVKTLWGRCRQQGESEVIANRTWQILEPLIEEDVVGV